MRRWRALWIGLLAGLLAGCTVSKPAIPSTWLDRLRLSSGPAGEDVIQMDVALLERPVGDRYLNQDLWSVADEQVVALDRKAALEDNGFRVGQVGGVTPAGLQALLTSDRSCANPRQVQSRAGKSTTLVLGPSLIRCQFSIPRDGRPPLPITLEQAHCNLVVVPSLTKDHRVRLEFTPQIQHGESALVFRAVADRSDWMLQERRPTEQFPTLSWDVTLAPNEYVVVGARYDRPQTLGHQSFIRPEEAIPVQRLLVIRTTRLGVPSPSAPTVEGTDGSPSPRTPPLAQQAGYSAARGISP